MPPFPAIPSELRPVFRYKTSWQVLTTLGIGGLLPVFAEPRNEDDLRALFHFCSTHRLTPFIMGGGSNLIGADRPDPSVLVIRIGGHQQFNTFSQESDGELCRAGAGLRLRILAEKAADLNLGGLSALAPIPGRLGGALVMNAGANGMSISDHLIKVRGLTFEGEDWEADISTLNPRYRHGGIPQGVAVTEAFFNFPASDCEAERRYIGVALAKRAETEPRGRSAGCIFRNPGNCSAGALLDRYGFKGFSAGGAAVSDRHANYAINGGNATEKDLSNLIHTLQSRICRLTGIRLYPEVRWVNPESAMNPDLNNLPHKIAVLKGGDSSEREISLKSGAAVASALRDAGYTVEEIDLHRCEIPPTLRDCELVFPVLHGGFGEDGSIQKLLENEKIPFVGCGSACCALTMDKIKTKRFMDEHGIPNAKWTVLNKTDGIKPIPEGFSLPLVVKASGQGSSVGVTIVKRAEQWEEALESAWRYGEEALIEAFIKGKEVAIGVIGGEPLPLIELRFQGEFYDYDAKYTYKNGQTEYLCPPPDIPVEVQKKAQAYAVDFAKGCGADELIRIDFIIDENGTPYILEGNTIPGFTASSLVPKAAAVNGLTFVELCAKLVLLGLRKKLGWQE